MATKLPNPYERFRRGDLILRDELAIDRTILANERTLLSYVRTALAFAVTGAGIIKFFDGVVVMLFGVCVILCGIGIAGLGVVRSRRVSRRIQISRDATTPPPTRAATS